MPTPRAPLAALAALALTSCATTAGLPAETRTLARIAALEDRRSTGEGALQALTGPVEPVAVRQRALLALARLQDPATAPDLARALGDADPRIREGAAFAAGQLGLAWVPLEEPVRGALAAAVLEAEGSEGNPAAREAELEALGRLRTPAALERLTQRLELAGPLAARPALALGVGVKGGGALPALALERLVALTRPARPREVRHAAAWALAQTKAPAALPAQVACTLDADPEVRAVCAKGLAEHGGAAETAPLEALLLGEDPRVAAEAARSLARIASRCQGSSCPALDALASLGRWATRLVEGDRSGAGQPLLALAQAPLPAAAGPLLARLRLQLQPGLAAAAPRVRADAAGLDCRLAAAQDRVVGTLLEVHSCGGGQVSEVRRLSLGLRELAVGPPPASPEARVKLVSPWLQRPEAPLRLAAIEALGAAGSPLAIPPLRAVLDDADPVLAAAAAGALGTLGDAGAAAAILALARRLGGHAEVAPALAEALGALKAREALPELRTWLAQPGEATRSAAAVALAAITGAPVPVPRVERAEAAPAPAPLLPGTRVRLETVRGPITLALLSSEAPRTGANLVALARRGFLDGLTFHRIVPDFVAQGGDPRGDGEGGPGYTVRCEINRHPYRRGAVGMALSGKDTGGSQFFLTLAPQPHLEGRYTVFAEVVEGLELADALLEGDAITRAVVLEP